MMLCQLQQFRFQGQLFRFPKVVSRLLDTNTTIVNVCLEEGNQHQQRTLRAKDSSSTLNFDIVLGGNDRISPDKVHLIDRRYACIAMLIQDWNQRKLIQTLIECL